MPSGPCPHQEFLAWRQGAHRRRRLGTHRTVPHLGHLGAHSFDSPDRPGARCHERGLNGCIGQGTAVLGESCPGWASEAHSVDQDGRPGGITGRVMNGYTTEQSAALVAACAAAAAHRRDHHHAAPVSCHPHVVEVVHLGHRAVTVCHDCESDSGFLPELRLKPSRRPTASKPRATPARPWDRPPDRQASTPPPVRLGRLVRRVGSTDRQERTPDPAGSDTRAVGDSSALSRPLCSLDVRRRWRTGQADYGRLTTVGLL